MADISDHYTLDAQQALSELQKVVNFAKDAKTAMANLQGQLSKELTLKIQNANSVKVIEEEIRKVQQLLKEPMLGRINFTGLEKIREVRLALIKLQAEMGKGAGANAALISSFNERFSPFQTRAQEIIDTATTMHQTYKRLGVFLDAEDQRTIDRTRSWKNYATQLKEAGKSRENLTTILANELKRFDPFLEQASRGKSGNQLVTGGVFQQQVEQGFQSGKNVTAFVNISDAEKTARTEAEFFTATMQRLMSTDAELTRQIEKDSIIRKQAVVTEAKARADLEKTGVRNKTLDELRRSATLLASEEKIFAQEKQKNLEYLRKTTKEFNDEQIVAQRAQREENTELGRQARLVAANRKLELAAIQKRINLLTNAQLKEQAIAAQQRNDATEFRLIQEEQARRTAVAAKQFEAAEARKARALKTTKEHVERVTLSFQSLIHIAAIRLFTTSILRLTTAVRESVAASIELQERLSEVRTIAQNSAETYIQWRDTIREVSDAFGLDIIDQTEAAYDALSNQVIDSALDFKNFGITVNEFATAAVGTAEDANNLLAAAINSFSLNVRDADEIAASFFKTIDLGRVRMSEMAGTLGTTGAVAGELGVKLEEFQAAIASITISGVPFSQTNTQIRNILLKLLKPTEEMKDLFRELGVESGEAAIKTFGFTGLLNILQEKTKGSSGEMGEFFSTIRAVNAALRLTGSGADAYNTALQEIKDSTETYRRVIETVFNSTGKKLKIELNKIKNFFKIDFADSLLNSLGSITNNFQNFADTIIATMKSIRDAGVIIAGLAAVIYSVLNPLTVLIGVLGYITLRLDTIIRVSVHTQKEQAKELGKAWENTYSFILDKSAKIFRATQKKTEETIEAIDKALAQSRAKQVAEANKIFDSSVLLIETYQDIAKASVKDFVDALGNEVAKLNSEVNNLKQKRDQLVAEIKNGKLETSNNVFDVSIANLPPINQIQTIYLEIDKLRLKAQRAARQGDKENFDAIEQRLKQLFTTSIELRKNLNRSGIPIDQNPQQETLIITHQLLSLDHERENLQIRMLRRTNQQVQEEEKLLLRKQLQQTEVQKAFDLVTSFKPTDLEAITNSEELTKQINQQKEAAKILQGAFKSSGLESQLVDLEAFQKALINLNEVNLIRITNQLNDEKTLELQDQVNIKTAEYNKLMDELATNLNKINVTINNLKESSVDFVKNQAGFSIPIIGGKFTVQEKGQKLTDLGDALGLTVEQALRLEEILPQIDQIIRGQKKVTPEQIEQYEDFFKIFDNIQVKNLNTESLDTLNNLQNIRSSLATLGTNIYNSTGQALALDRQRANLQERQNKILDEYLDRVKTQGDVTIGLSNAAATLKQAFEDLLIAEQNLYNFKTSVPGFAMGGHGQDTQLAYINPNEYIINASGVTGNERIISAINHGMKFDKTNNVTFHNNFNQEVTGNNRMQARRIANTLRRQMSQGRATLFSGVPF